MATYKNGLLHLDQHAILQDRFLAENFLQRGLTSRLIELFEPIEAVVAIAHQLTGFGDIVHLLRQFQHATFALMIFCSVVIVIAPFVTARTLSDCQINF
jgi:hypothetical protein